MGATRRSNSLHDNAHTQEISLFNQSSKFEVTKRSRNDARHGHSFSIDCKQPSHEPGKEDASLISLSHRGDNTARQKDAEPGIVSALASKS
jgi:hypothetical protein